MKNLKLLTILLCVMFFATVNAQNQTTKTDDAKYIEVNGTAELIIEPDEIYIRIHLLETSDNPLEKQETNLKKTLETIGIDLKNLSLESTEANLHSGIFKGKDLIRQKYYVLKVNSATLLSKVFAELDKLKIKEAFIQKVTHSKLDSLNKVIRVMAIKNAKEKADYLLSAINEKCGKALIVSEILNNSTSDDFLDGIVMHHNLPSLRSRRDYRGDISENFYDDNTEVDFRKITISFTIYVKFEIL